MLAVLAVHRLDVALSQTKLSNYREYTNVNIAVSFVGMNN